MQSPATPIGRAMVGTVIAPHAVLHNQCRAPFRQSSALDVDLLVTPAACTAFAFTDVGRDFFRELQRWCRVHENRPVSPSLRGTPTPEELAGDWGRGPRSLATCLRLGSRLADLEPTLDSSLIYKTLPNGRKHIVARNGGIKGWLRDHRVPVRYNTVMRYKKLAQRLRQILALDERIPLEWLLSGIPADHALPAGLSVPFETAYRQLKRLLQENPTLTALARIAEKKLGIQRLVHVRRISRRRRKAPGNFPRSRHHGAFQRERSATAVPARVEATKKVLKQLLGTRHLAGPALHLQNRARRWLEDLRS